AEEMLALGYKQVGKDFPVFLHPETNEEYALARKEIKIGDKHTDFNFVFDADISLEEDVQRRDFTINALAKDIKTGEIVDFVGGIDDINKKIIRHVNDEHFAEDPLRVLRMCRFAADLDFSIAPETMKIAGQMVKNNMLSHLASERIWEEIKKALGTTYFEKFIFAAKECGALKFIFPEADIILSKQKEQRKSTDFLRPKFGENLSAKNKFALFLLDISKYYGQNTGINQTIAEKICARLSVSKEYKKIAVAACKNYSDFLVLPQMPPENIFDYVSAVSADFKNREQMLDLFEIYRCDAENFDDVQKRELNENVDLCTEVFEKAKDIRAKDMPEFSTTAKDAEFARLYKKYRIERIFKS
ncbi:MAG: hypothetical protein IKO06_06680, partial [Alphaproteobacteria bacterium]|nr:hypothetical protein [Alphaproteobacteria bacterium]